MKKALAIVALFGWSSLFICCGSAGFAPGKLWQPGEERFFDDGLDLIKDPSQISGEWAYNYQSDLDGRVQLADLVAEIEVFSIQTTRDMAGADAKRIEVSIKEILLGNAPDKTVVLESEQKSPGYELLLRHENRLSGRFLVFLRWFTNEDGDLASHFHLSPVSASIKSEVLKRIESRRIEEEKKGLEKKRK